MGEPDRSRSGSRIREEGDGRDLHTAWADLFRLAPTSISTLGYLDCTQPSFGNSSPSYTKLEGDELDTTHHTRYHSQHFLGSLRAPYPVACLPARLPAA